MARVPLARQNADGGYMSAPARGRGGSFMRPPSTNAMVVAAGKVRAFRGVDDQAELGSRLFFSADGSFAGLGSGAAAAAGAVFKLALMLGAIGSGQVRFAGADVAGFVASQVLSFIKKSGGVYAAGAGTGPFQAGHAQPSAPVLYAKSVPSAGKTGITGAIAGVCWRVSEITGQVSLMSLPSNIVTLNNQTAIMQVPNVDANGQTHFGVGVPKIGFVDLGNMYQLPTSLGGEVSEATLSYTRAVGSTTVPDASNVATSAPGAGYTGADVGRRLAFGTFDSWITQVNSDVEVVLNDTNTSGAAVTGPGTVTHAVEGYTRAVEIGYANGSLAGQPLAPSKAFPPPPGDFAGVMKDVCWLDAGGVIYIGEPNYLGSFPPRNAQYASEPAVAYLQATDDMTLRFGRHSAGALVYVGGSPAVEYQELWDGSVGISHPQNVAPGAPGRVLIWLGRPAVLSSGVEPDITFADPVMPDFEGWDAGQTADKPVVPQFDPKGLYEVWMFGKKVMPFYVPTGQWCSPVDLTGKVGGDIVSAHTFGQKLYICCLEAGALKRYEFDAGTGSTMLVQFDDYTSNEETDTVTALTAKVRADNDAHTVDAYLVLEGDDDNPHLIWSATPEAGRTQTLAPRRPNKVGVGMHAVRIAMTSEGGDCGVDAVVTEGEPSGVWVG